jgi:tRNA (guanine26-N2/guanine27-N2)-dimethyltransferase
MMNENLIKKKEGSVEFFIYKQDSEKIPSKSMNVFYNEKMILNRDVTNLAIGAYKKLWNLSTLKFIDSMAASGVGTIRLLKELKEFNEIYINDLNPLAVNLIKKNLQINKIDLSKVVVSQDDANSLFSKFNYQNSHTSDKMFNKVDIISIDPFGTPNLYIDMAFKAIKSQNGLMCITATDTPVLFGVKPNVCIRKYMSKSLHTEYCKEIGARILVYFISRMANINNLGIMPILSFYSNHFIRIFIITVKKKKRIIDYFSNYGYILHCNNCGYRAQISNNILEIHQNCPLCDQGDCLQYSGPLWIGKLHNEPFLREILFQNNRKNYLNKNIIEKKLKFALDEIQMPPFYYNIHNLCHKLKLKFVPKIKNVIETINNLNYKASRTHFDYLAIKTDMNILDLKALLVRLPNSN